MIHGRYRLMKQIGRGGMAEVFEAMAVGEHGFERRVAIKRLLATTGEHAERYRRMFMDEARIAAQLHHANIVAVIDFGIGDGMPFQVLEHVDGLDVHSLLKRADGRLPIPLALYIVIMVAHALEYAHAAEDADGKPLGIVHRDVTPGNILVAWSGDVKLTDFGIAFAHERAEQTMAGSTKGTPLYMAPEQMLGEATDRRTDLFSLGCVLHTMAVGDSPLANADQQFHVVSGEELVLDANLPADLRPIIERATRHDRRDRYRSAGELVAALSSVLAAYGVADSRSSLRDWLGGLRGSSPAVAASPPARGRLDALLDLDFVLAEVNDGVRSFHSIAAVTRVERPIGAPPPEALAPPMAARSSNTTRWRIAVVGIVAAILVVVVLVWTRRAGAPTQVVAETPATVDAGLPSLADAHVDASVGIDATVSVDALVSVDAPTSDAGSSAVVRPRARPPEVSPAKGIPRDETTIRDWLDHHRKAAAGFQTWVSTHADVARTLYDWETKTGGGRAVLSWLNTSSDTTFEGYLEVQPQRTLAALVARNPDAFADLAGWVHRYAKQVGRLNRKDVGLPWTTRP